MYKRVGPQVKIRIHSKSKSFLMNLLSWMMVVLMVVGVVSVALIQRASATTSGQMKFYLHKEQSDANQTYNSATLTPPEPAADTGTGTAVSSATFSTGSPAFCETSNNTTDADNQISSLASTSSSSATTGNICMATFISQRLGQAISFQTGDTNSITAQFWSSESNSAQVTANLQAYIYRWSGSGNPGTSDLIASVTGTTCADPGTSATSCTPTMTPGQNVTLNAGDRIAIIITMNVTGASTSRNVSVYVDSTARTAASVKMKYTALAYNNSNKPSLTGPMDDDFTTAAGTTSCTTSGVTYNSKWTCLLGTSTQKSGSFNAEDTSAAGAGDSSSWLWLTNGLITTTGGANSDFGTTPSNTYFYQTLPSAYGNGDIRTALNTPVVCQPANTNCTITTTESKIGLVLWTSNTDYIEMGIRPNNTLSGTTNSVCTFSNVVSGGSVVFSNDGTCLNPTTTSGQYNEVWLGWHDAGGVYTPQYSSDGTTWSNIGNSSYDVTHDAFTRVGYNLLVGWGTPVGQVSAAFDWFSSTLSTPSYNQTSASWFTNANSTAPGAVHGSANTLTYTTAATSEQVRLRLLLRVTGQVLAGSSPPYNLEYVDKGGGSCASPSGGTPSTYTAVTASTLIAYFNNATPADGANISTATGDPTDSTNTVIPETYEELNSFSPTQANLNDTNDGLWDFSLVDNGAAAGATYCFRAVDTSGATTTYTNYPELTIFSPGPSTDQILRGGEWFNGGSKQPFFWAQ